MLSKKWMSIYSVVAMGILVEPLRVDVIWEWRYWQFVTCKPEVVHRYSNFNMQYEALIESQRETHLLLVILLLSFAHLFSLQTFALKQESNKHKSCKDVSWIITARSTCPLLANGRFFKRLFDACTRINCTVFSNRTYRISWRRQPSNKCLCNLRTVGKFCMKE